MSACVKWLIIISALVVALAIGCFTPPDMDIFQSFHPIACKFYPYSSLNIFADACDGTFDLTIAGFIPWTRSFLYQGVAESIFYFPLFLIFPHWQSVILMGAIWWGFTIWFFVRLTHVTPWIALLIFGVNFFCAYNFLQDHQIGMQTAFLFAILLMAKNVRSSPSWRQRFGWNILLGITVFLGIEFKPVFAYYLPAIPILAIGLNLKDGMPVSTLIIQTARQCLPSIVIATGLTLLLLFAQMNDGRFYWEMSHRATKHYLHYGSVFSYLGHVTNMLLTYFLNFPNSASIVYGKLQNIKLVDSPIRLNETLLTLPFWLVVSWLYVTFYRCRHTHTDHDIYKQYKVTIASFLIAAFIMLMLICTQTKARHAFHLLPVMTCILAATAICADYLYVHGKLKLLWLTSLLAASQLACTAYVVWQTPRIPQSWDRFPAISYAIQPHIAKRAIIDNPDRGTYYISALFGPKELIATEHFWPLQDRKLEKLIEIARQNGRYVVFLRRARHDEEMEKLRTYLPTLQKLFPADGATSQWEVWGESGLLEAGSATP